MNLAKAKDFQVIGEPGSKLRAEQLVVDLEIERKLRDRGYPQRHLPQVKGVDFESDSFANYYMNAKTDANLMTAIASFKGNGVIAEKRANFTEEEEANFVQQRKLVGAGQVGRTFDIRPRDGELRADPDRWRGTETVLDAVKRAASSNPEQQKLRPQDKGSGSSAFRCNNCGDQLVAFGGNNLEHRCDPNGVFLRHAKCDPPLVQTFLLIPQDVFDILSAEDRLILEAEVEASDKLVAQPCSNFLTPSDIAALGADANIVSTLPPVILRADETDDDARASFGRNQALQLLLLQQHVPSPADTFHPTVNSNAAGSVFKEPIMRILAGREPSHTIYHFRCGDCGQRSTVSRPSSGDPRHKCNSAKHVKKEAELVGRAVDFRSCAIGIARRFLHAMHNRADPFHDAVKGRMTHGLKYRRRV